MATFQNTNFYSLRGLVFYLNDHQTLLQGPFIQKQTKIKFPFFVQNHGLGLKRCQCGDYLKSIFFNRLRGFDF